ncbi:MAG: hypothetical protein WC707_04325 [Candidatus Babeliaceae bacterium]|jgi:hypothetical protein
MKKLFFFSLMLLGSNAHAVLEKFISGVGSEKATKLLLSAKTDSKLRTIKKCPTYCEKILYAQDELGLENEQAQFLIAKIKGAHHVVRTEGIEAYRNKGISDSKSKSMIQNKIAQQAIQSSQK